MAKLTNTRILHIIFIFLIMVIFCPIANGKVIYDNDNVIHETNGSNPHFLQDAQVDTDNSLWPLQVGQVWVYIVTDSREPLSPWTMELHILETVNIESSDYYHIGSYDLRADEWETGVVFINSDENFVYKWDEGEYSVWPRDEMVAEHVNVPYGRFDALYYDEGDYYNYFVPGVGLVKTHQIEDEYTVTSELVDIHAPVPKTIIYVDDDATGVNNGTSWENAYTFLQEALADANDSKKPVEIRVAQGIYRPNEGLIAIPEFDWRATTFKLINNVALKGSYAGIGGEDPNARDIQTYKTILSGDLNGDDEPNYTNNSDNCYHVVTSSDTDNTAMLDGFMVTGGNANSGKFQDSNCIGGGMFNSNGNPTIKCCTFVNNKSKYGGGFYNSSGNPILESSTFSNNNAGENGGGMYIYLGEPSITNCIFRSNWAGGYGGGMYNDACDPILEGCIFIANSVDEDDGGGIYNRSTFKMILSNCTFIGNWAFEGGGMYNWEECNTTLINCTFIGNSAGDGGGMYNTECYPTITNCIFSGNSGGGVCTKDGGRPILINCTLSGNKGSGIYSYERVEPLITNCIIWGNTPDQIAGDANVSYSDVQGGWLGESNIDVDPCFAAIGNWEDPCGTPDKNWDDIWINGDYHLKSEMGRWDPNSETWVIDDVTSPCIDAGDPNSNFPGEMWPHGVRINMGAYGGTREASMSTETGGMFLPQVAFIYLYNDEAAESFDSLLEAYGCSTTLIKLTEVTMAPLDSYDLIIVSHDTQHQDPFSDPNAVAAIEDSGKPIVGLGDGGYDFFGVLGLSIGNPYGGHGSKNSIKVVDPNSSLFSTPYSIEIPQDRVLQVYSETQHIGIYLWPTIPETVTVLGRKVDELGYYPLVMQHNRYLLWGFTESPQKMTEIGKTLFINVIIWTANKAWESNT